MENLLASEIQTILSPTWAMPWKKNHFMSVCLLQTADRAHPCKEFCYKPTASAHWHYGPSTFSPLAATFPVSSFGQGWVVPECVGTNITLIPWDSRSRTLRNAQKYKENWDQLARLGNVAFKKWSDFSWFLSSYRANPCPQLSERNFSITY